jgi:hypothetical protein
MDRAKLVSFICPASPSARPAARRHVLGQPEPLLHTNDRGGVPDSPGRRGYLALVERRCDLAGGLAVRKPSQ